MAPPISLAGDDSVRRSASQSSRPNSIASGTTQRINVFSDEFALHTDSGEITPVDSIQDSIDLPLGLHDNPNDTHTSSLPISALPAHMSTERSDSTTKRSLTSDPGHRNAASLSYSDTDTQRSLSISSRLNRPQSHYNGPTAPSQPYTMYPQVTRASSIASESTVRPPERPFASQGGPEHPYAMYQNTVPEEDDQDINVVPQLGFSGVGTSFQGSSSSGNDTGDIVGSDGHVEQLPPYTRYADNVVAKGDMAEINQTHTVEQSSSAESTTLSPNTSNSESGLTPAVADHEQEEVARKECLYERSKQRKCCGIPVVILVLLIIVVLVSGAVGGVVGGVVGNRKGADHAKAASSATTIVWLDADPVTTGPSTPSCPTGHFTIPINNIGQVERCVNNEGMSSSWDCIDEASLGVTVFEENPTMNGGGDLSIQFDDYSLFPQQFRYGPQPPDFNGTKFAMQPVEDVDNRDYGVAMFFSHLFDKIIILPEDSLQPNSNKQKRAGEKQKLQRRQAAHSDHLERGDKPWYCYWNQTVEEFWIFLEKDIASPTASPAALRTSMTADFPSNYQITGSSSSPKATQTPTPMELPLEEADLDAAPPTASSWYGPKARRKRGTTSSSFPASGTQPNFPKLIKMVEKRKPHDNIDPYCQQMQVLDSWQVVAIPGIDVVEIDEAEFEDHSEGTSKRKRSAPGIGAQSLAKRSEDEIIADLESLCICAWRAG